jgi:hypothetical protein
VYYAKPSSPFGYYRGNPVFNGDGSNQGANVSGMNVFSSGQGKGGGADAGTGTWSPTILYLFVLILVEMFVFAWVSRHI